LQYEESTFCSFIDYYNALAKWIKKNKQFLNEDILRETRLTGVIDLNPCEYITDSPDIDLSMEKKRMFEKRPKTIKTLANAISGTLWSMVTTYSAKNCPVCMHGALGYVIVFKKQNNAGTVIRECTSCWWAEDMDGKEWAGCNVNIFPAHRKELFTVD
jgi:hypothetical protein